MDLKMPVKIEKPESTPTGNEPRASEPGGAGRGDPEHRFPPEHLRLKVVMTFEGGSPRLSATEAGVVAGGDSIQEAFRCLVEETRERLASSEGAGAELLDYPPATWFRFVPPTQTADAHRAIFAAGFASALNPLYEFRGDSVRGFLAENPFLGSLLFEAHEVIRKHFGPKVETALEVVVDPEALGDRQLFVVVQTELPREEARVRLAELDRGWWLDALPASKGKMEIALD